MKNNYLYIIYFALNILLVVYCVYYSVVINNKIKFCKFTEVSVSNQIYANMNYTRHLETMNKKI